MDIGQPFLDGFGDSADEPLCGITSISDRQLRLRDLAAWCKHQADLIARRTGSSPTGDSFLFAQAVKLGEEVGELQAEVLGFAKHQRLEKSDEFSSESLAGELADVTICVAILAEIVGVDLGRALIGKMENINERSQLRHISQVAPFCHTR